MYIPASIIVLVFIFLAPSWTIIPILLGLGIYCCFAFPAVGLIVLAIIAFILAVHLAAAIYNKSSPLFEKLSKKESFQKLTSLIKRIIDNFKKTKIGTIFIKQPVYGFFLLYVAFVIGTSLIATIFNL